MGTWSLLICLRLKVYCHLKLYEIFLAKILICIHNANVLSIVLTGYIPRLCWVHGDILVSVSDISLRDSQVYLPYTQQRRGITNTYTSENLTRSVVKMG